MEQNWVEVKKKNVSFKPYAQPRTNNSTNGARGSYEGRGTNSYKYRGRGGGYKPRGKPYATDIPDFNNEDEKHRFLKLQEDCSHIMMPGQSRRLQATLRIDGLAEHLLSEKCIELQLQGWKYVRVIKPDDDPDTIPESDDFDLVDLENKYGDCVLFQKI